MAVAEDAELVDRVEVAQAGTITIHQLLLLSYRFAGLHMLH